MPFATLPKLYEELDEAKNITDMDSLEETWFDDIE